MKVSFNSLFDGKDYDFDVKVIDYSVVGENVHVANSYLITDDNEKLKFIDFLLVNIDGLAEHRTAKSLFNEWKVHNALYQRGKWKNHTKDVDFEFKQKWYWKFIYWLFAKLLKEEVK